MERTVLALTDCSKGYDTVWRDALLWKLTKKGFSRHMVRWIQSWLSNRLAYVQFGNSRSKTKTFKQGVPHGSVISPILFLVYIDDIEEGLEEDLHVSLFADDVAVYAQSRDIEAASQKVQRALDHVNEWSLKSKLSISKEKCECSFFSTNKKESKHVLDLYIGGTRVKQTNRSFWVSYMTDNLDSTRMSEMLQRK